MLTVNGEEFASGVATYFEEDPSLGSEQTSIHVSVVVEGDRELSILARLDPATPWVILNAEINEQIGLRASPMQVSLRTVGGLMKGSLERLTIRLVAEQGAPLEIDATVFVCDEWQRENFLGYSGFLERIRFAVDPTSKKFYFGSPDK